METVLVVDDERFFLTILGDFITQGLGMRVLTAEDGSTALALLETERVDLVFLDIIMPGMDGLEVLRRIKGRWPNLPVIMLTASAAIDNAIIAVREGADDFFRKPVDLDELALCVTRVLGKSHVARRPAPTPLEAASEARRAPRIRMEEGLPGQLHLMEVYLIDISHSGALVEHTVPVNPGEIYRLCFPLDGKEVQVLARAIRVFASHREALAGGGRRIVYRTGMEFVGLEKGVAEGIARYVDRMVTQRSRETTT
jgi:CheY-like chemotaxis protein